jgi:transcription antitermination factor NusG
VEQKGRGTPEVEISSNIVLPWYALQVRSRQERVIAAALLSKGYEGFLPLYYRESRWSDRIKELILPLFPGYLFCRFDINNRLPVLMTPGVMRVVGIGKRPHPVDEEEISAIQAVVASGLRAEPVPYLSVGQKVRIEQGTLSGIEGILAGVRAPAKLVVSVSLLQRSISVEIDERWVKAAEPQLVH